MRHEIEPWMLFWGKARPSREDGPRFHPLACHGLDVAAAFMALVEAWPEQRAGLVASFEGDPESVLHGLAALIALHDVGKFAPAFQAKAPEVFPEAALGPARPTPVCDHAAVGYALAERRGYLDALLALLLGENDAARRTLFSPVFGHHGRPVDDGLDLALRFGRRDSPAAVAARAFASRILALFGDPVLPPLRPEAQAALSWRLAGLTALADWIGSDETRFPYAPPEIQLADYWERRAMPAARAAIAGSGLARAAVARGDSLRIVTGGAFAPTEAQLWAANVDVDKNGLFILEDVTGSGKTEAALTLAHRLMQAGRARGVYVALPTMATANGLYRRLGALYRRFYDPGERPSIVLAHGARALDPAFVRSIGLGDQAPERGYGDAGAEEDETATAACARWLADDSRRAFLVEIGVGTIDQAIMAVLPLKHAPVRQIGLSRQVLVIDEAHAYDPYMQAGIEALVAHQARMGAPVIVLSATLPARMRGNLAAAWRGERPRGETEAAPYPSALAVGEAPTCAPVALAARADLAREIAITRIETPEDAVGRIVAAAAAGGEANPAATIRAQAETMRQRNNTN